MLVLIGGLGSGKSTAMRYLCDLITRRRNEIAAQYPCQCNPCVRRPLIVDCNIDRDMSVAECESEILERLRRAIYVRLLDEWFRSNNLEPASIRDTDRKVLRRLLIANDIYHFSESERTELPVGLHTRALELPEDLLLFSPQDWNLPKLVRDHTRAADDIDHAIETASADPALARRFTALVIACWLSRCNRQSPNNLIVMDNLDQQPTDNIDELMNRFNDLEEHHRGLRLLVPLRPSSIVPHGFTRNIRYMFHYGPNCFDMIYRRLSKYVLLQNREALATALARNRSGNAVPPREETTLFLVATYLYALICINGMRDAVAAVDDVRPNVHEDEANLHNLRLAGTAIQQLADTLEAIVGTCGRYATDQLSRYFDHIYSHTTFLRQVEISGLAMGVAPRLPVPYGQIVSAILGAPEAELGANVTGLANLYSPSEPRANPSLPSLAKVRVLAFLAARRRVRVKAVTAALAQYGLPVEIAIEALNYLHTKKRLLLWFSHNANLKVTPADLEQYVVISEHGLAYLKDLVGDFEYVWFCAQQLVPRATAESEGFFVDRLQDYRNLLIDFARTEWKQMTFRRLAAGGESTTLPDDVRHDEMLTLFILYSSFERALRGAVFSSSRIEPENISEVAIVLDAIIDTIVRCQKDYQLYYGHNGYLAAYSRKIERCLAAAKGMSDKTQFASLKPKLTEVVESWSAPLVAILRAGADILPAGDEPDQIWESFVEGLPSSTSAAEAHARESLLVALRPFMERRRRVRRYLSRSFPQYGWIEHQVELLVGSSKVLYDVADRLAGYTAPLLGWLSKEAEGLEEVQITLAANRFSVPELVTMEMMDGFKQRANNISTAYVCLAQRLAVANADHLEVRWSI